MGKQSLSAKLIEIARIQRFRDAEPYRFAALATYNSERARGIVHTPHWEALMADEQLAFDREMANKYANNVPTGLTFSDRIE